MLRIEWARGALDPSDISDEEGSFLVRLARSSIREYLATGRTTDPRRGSPQKLLRPGAAFVTLERGEGRILRGCIGSVAPVEPLVVAVSRAAVEAATRDPRFPPLSPGELDSVVVEVTVLSRPEPLPRDPQARVEGVVVGRDGIIVVRPPYSGLLLPQVAVDEGWDSMTFLTWACVKAGLRPTCWIDGDTIVYRFTAAIWREEEPGGRIVRRTLKPRISG